MEQEDGLRRRLTDLLLFRCYLARYLICKQLDF